MNCQKCNQPFPMLFVMVEATPGASQGMQQKLVCFPCLTEIGERTMREWRLTRTCPTCKEPATGAVQGGARNLNICAKGHQW
jgi:hypothetical protein